MEQTITLYAKLTVVVRDSHEIPVDPGDARAETERIIGALIGEKVGHTWIGKDGPMVDLIAAGLVPAAGS